MASSPGCRLDLTSVGSMPGSIVFRVYGIIWRIPHHGQSLALPDIFETLVDHVVPFRCRPREHLWQPPLQYWFWVSGADKCVPVRMNNRLTFVTWYAIYGYDEWLLLDKEWMFHGCRGWLELKKR